LDLRNNSRSANVSGSSDVELILRTRPEFSKRNGMEKFMLSLRSESFEKLKDEADSRGISVQELIRAVIIPEWIKAAYRR